MSCLQLGFIDEHIKCVYYGFGRLEWGYGILFLLNVFIIFAILKLILDRKRVKENSK